MRFVFNFFFLFLTFFSCKKKSNYISETENYELSLITSYTITTGQKPNELYGYLSDLSLKPIFPNPLEFELIPEIPINNHLLGIPECNISNPDDRNELLRLLQLPTILNKTQFEYTYKSDPIAGKLFFTAITIKDFAVSKIPDLGCFSALESFTMNNTDLITVDPQVFSHLSTLNFLDLSNNSLIQVPLAIQDLLELTALNLANNKISFLNEFLIDSSRFKKLKLVLLSGNELTYFEPLSNLLVLEELYLAENDLDLSDEVKFDPFATLPFLQALDFSEQKKPQPIPRILLKQSDQNFRKLTTLYYRKNNLSAIDPGFVEDFDQYKKWLNFSIQYNGLNTQTENQLKAKINCMAEKNISKSDLTIYHQKLRQDIISGKYLNLKIDKTDDLKPCLGWKPQGS